LLAGRKFYAASRAVSLSRNLTGSSQAFETARADLACEVTPLADDLESRLGLERVLPVVDECEDLIDIGFQEGLLGRLGV